MFLRFLERYLGGGIAYESVILWIELLHRIKDL